MRPDAETAIVGSQDTVIDEVDGKNVQALRSGQMEFALPPGPHVLGFSMNRVEPGFFVTRTLRSDYVRVCLYAQAGARYFTAARVGDGQWEPYLLQKERPVGGQERRHEVPSDCLHSRLFPEAAAGAQGTTAGAAAPAAVPATRAGAPLPAQAPAPAAAVTASDDGAEGDDAETDDTTPPAPPPPRSGAREAASLWRRLPIWRPPSRPFLDIVLNLGFSFGGDNLVRAQLSNGNDEELNAGEGLVFGLGGMITPLWLAKDFVGFGAGADIGLKYDSIDASNADISFRRFPGTATVHALLRTADHWFVMLAGGVQKDLGIHISGDGAASGLEASLTSQVGGLGRLGLYYRGSDVGAMSFGLGYTKLSYQVAGTTLDASSFNLWFNFHAAYQPIAAGTLPPPAR